MKANKAEKFVGRMVGEAVSKYGKDMAAVSMYVRTKVEERCGVTTSNGRRLPKEYHDAYWNLRRYL